MRCRSSARSARGLERRADRAGRCRAARGALLQLPQDLDLRRLERDPAEHHRQDDPGAVNHGLQPQRRTAPAAGLRQPLRRNDYALRAPPRRDEERPKASAAALAQARRARPARRCRDEEHGGSGGRGRHVRRDGGSSDAAWWSSRISSTVVVGRRPGRARRHDRQSSELLAPLADGAAAARLRAWREARRATTLADVQTSRNAAAVPFCSPAHKSVVLHGATAGQADRVGAHLGAQRDARGISLFLVDRAPRRVPARVTHHRRPARRRHHVRRGPGPPGCLIGTAGRRAAGHRRSIDAAIAALCAEAVGAMEALNETTLDYLKTRQQFGAPIGPIPGAAAPHGRHVHRLRTGALDGAAWPR